MNDYIDAGGFTEVDQERLKRLLETLFAVAVEFDVSLSFWCNARPEVLRDALPAGTKEFDVSKPTIDSRFVTVWSPTEQAAHQKSVAYLALHEPDLAL